MDPVYETSMGMGIIAQCCIECQYLSISFSHSFLSLIPSKPQTQNSVYFSSFEVEFSWRLKPLRILGREIFVRGGGKHPHGVNRILDGLEYEKCLGLLSTYRWTLAVVVVVVAIALDASWCVLSRYLIAWCHVCAPPTVNTRQHHE